MDGQRRPAGGRAELVPGDVLEQATVNAARLAVAAPWIVLALLSTRPESVPEYDTAAGAAVLAAGAVATLVAYRLMVRIGRLPEEGRVLR